MQSKLPSSSDSKLLPSNEDEKILRIPAPLVGRHPTLPFAPCHRHPHRLSPVRLHLPRVDHLLQCALRHPSATIGRLRLPERLDHHQHPGTEALVRSFARLRHSGQSNSTASGRPRVRLAADSNIPKAFETKGEQIFRGCTSDQFCLLDGILTDHTSSRS